MTTPTKQVRFIATVALLACFVLLPALASAHPHSHPRLRARIESLEANLVLQINSLQSQLDYQARRTESLMPGGGMCGDPCTVDSDDDGIGDCDDVCPCADNDIDSDRDGTADCSDPCPDDDTDACTNPCGTDGDHDGTNDCDDPCPFDPAAPVDSDGDGIHDCNDACPNNVDHDCYAGCEWDQDGDGLPDCSDPCPWAPEHLRVSMHGGDGDHGMMDCPMPHN